LALTASATPGYRLAMADDLAYRSTASSGAKFSIPSIIAIICAIASWFVGAGLSILLAIVAIVFGLIGVVMSIHPARRGGTTSIFAVLLGALALVVSIIALIFNILT
jgi:hypothetical protein